MTTSQGSPTVHMSKEARQRFKVKATKRGMTLFAYMEWLSKQKDV